MRKVLAFTFINSLLLFNAYAQDLKTEYTTAAGETISECDCKNLGDVAINVKIWIPESTFLYDQVTFHFDAPTYPDFAPTQTYSGKQVQAKCGSNGYIMLQAYFCGSYEKKDLVVSTRVTGSMITSYKEEVVNNTVVQTPIYGRPDAIGVSASIPVHVNAADAKKKMRKMYILSAAVCGTLLVLYLTHHSKN